MTNEKLKKALSCKHLVFAHSSLFKEWKGDSKAIIVLTHRINGRNYKKKVMIIGEVITYIDRKKGEQYCFRPGTNLTLQADTVGIIFDFLKNINDGLIKLDKEKGEFELL